MKNGKGQITVAIAVVGVLAALMILGLMLSFEGSMKEKIKVDTVGVIAKRVESATYMMSGIEKGRTEINLKSKYGFEKNGRKKFVNYTSDAIALAVLENKNQKEINPPVEFRLASEGKTKKICIEKKPEKTVRIELGRC